MLELPETFDKTLIPEGRYRLEAQMAAIASFKLVERPVRPAEDPQPEQRGARSEGDETSPVPETELEPVAAVPEQRAPDPDAEPLESYIEGLKALQNAANARGANQDHCSPSRVVKNPDAAPGERSPGTRDDLLAGG